MNNNSDQQETNLSQSNRSEDFEFEICVKPKRKFFNTKLEHSKFIAEFTKKKKTELCKNYGITGTCKFGDKCSFAHGFSELREKEHLHSNYKTKPCKKYLLQGSCSYGIRCQYIHSEIKKLVEHRRTVKQMFFSQGLPQPLNPEGIDIEEYSVKYFQNVGEQFNINTYRNRLETFKKFCNQ